MNALFYMRKFGSEYFSFFIADLTVKARLFTFCECASTVMQWLQCSLKISEQAA
jgi:hypothetical protein